MIIDIPKKQLSAALQSATLLNRLPNGEFSTRLRIKSESGRVRLMYTNSPYGFVMSFPVHSTDKFDAVCSVSTLQKILSACGDELSIRYSDGSSEPVVLLPGEASIPLETIDFNAEDYTFNGSRVLLESKDSAAFHTMMKGVVSLLPAAVSVADRCIICKNAYTYVNVGSVLVRASNPFGFDFSVSKYLLDALAPMLPFGAEVLSSIHDSMMTLMLQEDDLSTRCKFVFPVTSDAQILSSFLSPLFVSVFNHSDEQSGFQLPITSVLSHMKLLLSLGTYDENVTISVHAHSVSFTVKSTSCTPFQKEYDMTSGSAEPMTITVPLKLVIAALDMFDTSTEFVCGTGGLLMKNRETVYCIRSIK